MEPSLSSRITLFWFCAVTSSPSYLSERELALLLVWPHLLSPYTGNLLEEKSCLFFPKEMLRVLCLDRQHPKWVPWPQPRGGGAGGGGAGFIISTLIRVTLIVMVKVLRHDCSCLVL